MHHVLGSFILAAPLQLRANERYDEIAGEVHVAELLGIAVVLEIPVLQHRVVGGYPVLPPLEGVGVA